MNELQSAFLKMAVPAALETQRLLGVGYVELTGYAGAVSL